MNSLLTRFYAYIDNLLADGNNVFSYCFEDMEPLGEGDNWKDDLKAVEMVSIEVVSPEGVILLSATVDPYDHDSGLVDYAVNKDHLYLEEQLDELF